MTRTSRELETRNTESRANSMVEEYSMEYKHPYDFAPGVIRDGYVGKWVNTEIKGCPTNRVNDHASRGWELVPSERCPGFSDLKDPLKRNPLSQHYLCAHDVVAMEIPEEKFYAAQRAIHNWNDRLMQSLLTPTTNEHGVQRVITR